jgi:glycosyltransferase involved in cell wall biosynthesis
MTINRIIITHPRSLNAPGGGTRSCLQITHHLEQLGIEVILLSVTTEAAEQFQGLSTQVITVAPNPVHYYLDGIAVAQTVQQICTKQSIDAVISWEAEAAFLLPFLRSQNIVFGIVAAAPSYTEWVNRKTKFRALKGLSDRWFRWRLFQQADVVFVSSQFTQDEMTALFGVDPKRIVITRRGVDDLFTQIERSPSTTISNFIFYGSFAPIKGVFDAIDAVSQVAAQGQHHWKLKLAGWGNEAAVKQAIQERGIEDQVQILGKLSPQELAMELAWADLALLPSQAESFGRAIAEAQAAGLAVISYDTGSIPEIVVDGVTGWLVPHKRIDLLADAILQAMQDPQETNERGRAGRDRVVQLFTWEKTAKCILDGLSMVKHQTK